MERSLTALGLEKSALERVLAAPRGIPREFSAILGAKWVPKQTSGESQIGPGGLLEGSWRSLGALKKAWSAKGGLPGAYGALLEASWVALGAEKRSLERLLAAPRGIPREVSAILRAKRLPKRSPGGSQIGSRRRLQLKRAKSQNLEDVSRNSLIFKVPGPPFGSKNGTKTGSQSQHRR